MSNFDPKENWPLGAVEKPARLVSYLAEVFEIDNKTVYRHIRGKSPGRFLGVSYLRGVITIEGIPAYRGPVASDFEELLFPKQLTEWNLNPASGVVNSQILFGNRSELEKYTIVEVRSVVSGQVVKTIGHMGQNETTGHATLNYRDGVFYQSGDL